MEFLHQMSQTAEQTAKLIVSDDKMGGVHQFIIFNQQEIGRGAFGVVKRAIETENPYEPLAVKIIPFGSETKKAKIEREIQILRQLPPSKNLVKVIPLKCFSETNFYIFMEYCPDGTLEALMKPEVVLTEETIFDVLLQIMEGYRPLWSNKILHQDLKPDNILRKGNTLKITDFGFSILYEGYHFTSLREGTLLYMPLEKLSKLNYEPSTKSDVYSIGVIMFKLITKRHPYFNGPRVPQQEHLRMLKYNKLDLPKNFASGYSLRFQYFFNLVVQMVAKTEERRISFEELYGYIEREHQLNNSDNTKEKEISQQFDFTCKKYTIVDQSTVITIPFEVPKEEESQYIQKTKEKRRISKQIEERVIVNKLSEFVISMRLVVSFFDRFSRRLYVQTLKNIAEGRKENEDTFLNNHTILGILLLERKIIDLILKEAQFGGKFPKAEWKVYMSSEKSLIGLIRKDENYVENIIIDTLSETKQVKVHEQRRLIDSSKQELHKYIELLRQIVAQLLQIRMGLIDVQNNNKLVTICYCIDTMRLLGDWQNWSNYQQEEDHFRNLETEEPSTMLNKIMNYATEAHLDYRLSYEEEA